MAMNDGCPVCGSEAGYHYIHGGYDPPDPAEAYCDECGFFWQQSGFCGYAEKAVPHYVEKIREEVPNLRAMLAAWERVLAQAAEGEGEKR